VRLLAALVAVFGLLMGLVLSFHPQAASAVSSGTFYSLAYDGTLSNYGTTYSEVHNNTLTDNVVVEYTTTSVRVGRTKVSSTFYEYRPVFFFDTADVPAGAQVASAYVTLHGVSNHSTTDFDLDLVTPGDIHNPMVVTDYATMLPHTTALNQAFNTSSYASEMILNLNTAGIAAIIHEGVTVMGLRSSLDIAGTPDPAGDEYIDIYASESARPPTLTIVYYSIGVLGTPDTMSMASVIVYSGYRETGDQLWLLRSDIKYNKGTENLDSREYWSVEILDDNSTVVASSPLWSWGYVPASIYLSATNALSWGDYSVKLTGNADKYPSAVPYVSYALNDGDYKGTDNTVLDQWCMSTAIDIGRVEADDLDYYRTQISGKWVINDAGQILFSSGVPLIESVRPNLFLNPSPEGGEGQSGHSYADLLWPNWGVSLMGDWALIASLAGMSGQLLASTCFFALIFAIVYVVDKETGKPILGMIPGSLGLIAGTLLGSPNLVVLLSLLGLAVIYFYYETIPTRT
jgi:hypothetical protein